MDINNTYGGYLVDLPSTIQALQEYSQEPTTPTDKIWLQLVVEDDKITLKAMPKSKMPPCQIIMNCCRIDVFGFNNVIAFLQEHNTLLTSNQAAKTKFEQAFEHYNNSLWFDKSSLPLLKKVERISQTIYTEPQQETPIEDKPIDTITESSHTLEQSLYLDGWLENLKEISTDNPDAQTLSYLHGELQGLDTIIFCQEMEIAQSTTEESPKGWFATFKDGVLNFKKALQDKIDTGAIFTNSDITTSKSTLNVSFVDGSGFGNMSSIIRVPGIENVGNSCYMNSALQGLFASPIVTHAIDTCRPKRGEEKFVSELKKFLDSYRNYRNKPNGNFHSVGRSASKLHYELYQAKLKPYIDDLYDMADADLIAMALGEVLGLEYTLVTRRIAKPTNTNLGDIVHDIETKQFVWPEIQTAGTKNELSLQEAFNQHCACIQEEHNLGWKYTTNITINDAKTGYRLKGSPPSLIVFKVGKSEGVGMDAKYTPYNVTARDKIFDASSAFDSTPKGSTKYRLISVLQNHHRMHWTAMTRHQNRWYNCDDDIVNKIGTHTPNIPAAIMIYERVT